MPESGQSLSQSVCLWRTYYCRSYFIIVSVRLNVLFDGYVYALDLKFDNRISNIYVQLRDLCGDVPRRRLSVCGMTGCDYRKLIVDADDSESDPQILQSWSDPSNSTSLRNSSEVSAHFSAEPSRDLIHIVVLIKEG